MPNSLVSPGRSTQRTMFATWQRPSSDQCKGGALHIATVYPQAVRCLGKATFKFHEIYSIFNMA